MKISYLIFPEKHLKKKFKTNSQFLDHKNIQISVLKNIPYHIL